jgi:ADP-ribose pyrophosphatase
VKNQEMVFDQFFKIEKALLSWQQFDGSMTGDHTRFVIRRGDSVGILCVCTDLPDQNVVLIKQFRYPTLRKKHQGYLWEIPAGMIDEGEDPETSARRELEEETGLKAGRLTLLTSFFLTPGAMDEKMYLYRAEVSGCGSLQKFGGNEEEQEDMLIRAFRMEQLLDMIKRGVIADGKTIAAVLLHRCLPQG